jgi:hypothetical protein
MSTQTAFAAAGYRAQAAPAHLKQLETLEVSSGWKLGGAFDAGPNHHRESQWLGTH